MHLPMSAMRALAPRTLPMQRVVARRTQWMHDAGVVEATRRVTSASNLWADIASRPEKGGLPEVARQAALCGLQFCEVPVPAEWRDTSGLRLPEPCWGPEV